MPHFKVTAAFGSEQVIEAEDMEAARSQVNDPDVTVEEYTPSYGQTLIMGASKSGYGGVYGYGDDLAAAKAGFRKNGGVLSKGYTLVVFDAETDFVGVTGIGGYRWIGNHPTVTVVTGR